MAYLEVHRENLIKNYKFLDDLFKANKKEWAVVTKMLCGNRIYIEEIVKLGVPEICDSRISNLQVVKSIDPEIQTVYIKPPAKKIIPSIVKYADVSFNTELETIKLLSKEAVKQNKLHKIIIMVELGDLREGVMGDTLVDFYAEVFHLPGIQITGIGTNLNCLHGVLPSEDKLIQLSLYKQLIETKFNRKIPWVTGGTSVIIPLLYLKQVPEGVNHFRIGETLYFGKDIIADRPIKGMSQEVIKFYAQIIEITEKPVIPIGVLAQNPSGETFEVKKEDYGKTALRAILDVGLLDISIEFLIPEDSELRIIGASSDMIVLDLNNSKIEYKVGDFVSFKVKYMGALGLMNSGYIEKRMI